MKYWYAGICIVSRGNTGRLQAQPQLAYPGVRICFWFTLSFGGGAARTMMAGGPLACLRSPDEAKRPSALRLHDIWASSYLSLGSNICLRADPDRQYRRMRSTLSSPRVDLAGAAG
jgi:hypothetical protein